jgi:hypothetical protein
MNIRHDIKEIGRGKHGARALSRAQVGGLRSRVLIGHSPAPTPIARQLEHILHLLSQI